MSRDVIFVPGLPGSDLNAPRPQGGREKIFPRTFRRLQEMVWKTVDPRLLGPDNLTGADPVEAGDPVDRIRILVIDLKQARSLYDVLTDECNLSSHQIHRVGWDWRRPVSDGRVRTRLTNAITNAPEGSVLVVHSTGGLVARSVLRADPQLCRRLSAVVAFGVPWLGTLKPLAVLLKLASLTAADRADARRVMAHSWAAMDLLPRANARLTVKGNGQPYDLFSSVEWLPSSPQWLRRAVRPRLAHSLATVGVPARAWGLPVDLHNVAGFGEETAVLARIVGGQTRLNVTPGGADLDSEEICLGDGTVPFSSAGAIRGGRVKDWIVPIGAYRRMGKKTHSALWSNPGGVKALVHTVTNAPRPSLTELALDTSAYSPRTRIRLRYSVFGANGRPAPGEITITTPSSPSSRGPFPTDATKGHGTLVFPRGHFHAFRQGSERKRRVKATLRNSSDGSTTDVFALVPA